MGGYYHSNNVTFDIETDSLNDTSGRRYSVHNTPEPYQGNRKQRRAQAAQARRNNG